MNTFHRYPLDDDQHPERPWWRLVGTAPDPDGPFDQHAACWRRLDGVEAITHHIRDELARVDEEHTLAAPIVRPKKEWRDPDGTHWVVLHIDGETGHPAAFR